MVLAIRFVASRTALEDRPVGPPKETFFSTTATLAPSFAAYHFKTLTKIPYDHFKTLIKTPYDHVLLLTRLKGQNLKPQGHIHLLEWKCRLA